MVEWFARTKALRIFDEKVVRKTDFVQKEQQQKIRGVRITTLRTGRKLLDTAWKEQKRLVFDWLVRVDLQQLNLAKNIFSACVRFFSLVLLPRSLLALALLLLILLVAVSWTDLSQAVLDIHVVS